VYSIERLDSPQHAKGSHRSRTTCGSRVHPRNCHLIVDAQKEVLASEDRSGQCNQKNGSDELGFGNDQALLCRVRVFELGQGQRHVEAGTTAEDADAMVA
jgi:hypothetical protein